MKLSQIIGIGLLCFWVWSIIVCYIIVHKCFFKLERFRKQNSEKLFLIRLYDIWMMLKQEEKNMEMFLVNKGVKSVAIYGASFLGIRLYYELRNTSIDVKVIYDKSSSSKVAGIEVKNLDESIYEEVDMVIITDLFAYDEIEKLLKSKGYEQITSIDEILYEMLV